MIYISGKCAEFSVSRLYRCKDDPCNIYQLILQHIQSKCITIFKVRDISINHLRYCFKFELPDCFPSGEYNYFLVSSNEWGKCDLNQEIVKNTRYYADKRALSINGMKIIADNKLLVLSSFKAVLFFGWKKLSDGENILITTSKTSNKDKTGDIVETLDILNSGLLRYDFENILPQEVNEYSTESKYKVYEG